MDITTALPAPSSTLPHNSSLILKFSIIITFFIFSKILTYSSTSETDNDNDSTNNLLETMEVLSFCLNKFIFFIRELLPRLVAASFTYHIGLCCLYVGMAHLKIIRVRWTLIYTYLEFNKMMMRYFNKQHRKRLPLPM